MHLKHLIILALCAVFFTACNDGKTKIYGTAMGANELILMASRAQQMDTIQKLTVADDGEFSFELEDSVSNLYFLRALDNFAIPLFVQPGEQVKVTTTDLGEKDPTYEVSGSPESERIKEIDNVLAAGFERVDSLNNVSQSIKETNQYARQKPKMDSVFQSIIADTREKYIAMIDEKPGSMANIFIFSRSFGNVPILSPQEDFEYIQKVAKGLQENYPDLEITQSFQQNVDQMEANLAAQEEMKKVRENLVAGNPVPEIEMAGPDGKTHKLSDLRGKVVLVDFWAAWCKPCRMENPNLVRLYNNYKDQGFDIFSVSLDGLAGSQQNPKEQWTQAIEQDGLIWENHVSQLQGWQSPVAKKFGLQSIPFTLLVGRDGNIIATEVRGPALEIKLKEALGES